MHGVIFASFRDYVAAAQGSAAAAELFDDQPPYLLSESYPDEWLMRLVEQASRRAGREADQTLFDFGVFTAETTFARLYPAFFDVSSSTREFLLTVETRIHELVRATIPKAGPPQLDISPLGEDGVSIFYDSPRRLCVLLRGLAEGTARHYGEQTVVDEPTCMHRGDPACNFAVRFSPDSLSP
jgi:hypothetical protein